MQPSAGASHRLLQILMAVAAISRNPIHAIPGSLAFPFWGSRGFFGRELPPAG